jgi:hypothetical protein
MEPSPMMNLPHPAPDVQPDFGDDAVDFSPSDLAYDLSYTLARRGEPASSPRTLDRAIRKAHFQGTAAGLAAREADLADEAWARSIEHDRMEDAFGSPIGDSDLYRVGGVS